MGSALPAAGVVAMTISLVGGCSGSTAGSPVPANTGATVTDAPSTPPRPRELRLDGIEPCTLVPESDWPTFYIERPGRSKTNKVFNSPECFYSNYVGGFAVTLVLTEGVEAWADGKRQGKPGEVTPISGFPTIKLTLEDDKNTCSIAVDVAPGQYLKTAVDIDNRKLQEVPEICDYAHQLAASAMKTLVAREGG